MVAIAAVWRAHVASLWWRRSSVDMMSEPRRSLYRLEAALVTTHVPGSLCPNERLSWGSLFTTMLLA
jgi:hypothetical protein